MSENWPARGKLQHFTDLILYIDFILYPDFILRHGWADLYFWLNFSSL